MKFEDINEQVVDNLIKNKIQESIILDYKSNLIEDNKLVKHVSAFANTKGGVILIGVETNKNDEPIRKTPVPKKNKEKERIEQILNTGITPKISGVRIKEIKCSFDQNKCFYIIKIPMSIYGHMVTRDRDHRYYRRVYGRQNFQALEMEEHEVAELYERRFSSRELIKSWTVTRFDELKQFKIRGNALNVIVRPIVASLQLIRKDELYDLTNLMNSFSIPKSEKTQNPTKNGLFWADKFAAVGLAIDGSVLSRVIIVDDSPQRVESIHVEVVLDTVFKTLRSAFSIFNSPSVGYYGGFIVAIEIEDTVGRQLVSNAISRFTEPKKCKSQSINAEVIRNSVEDTSMYSVLNDLLKEFIGEFGFTSNYSERFLAASGLKLNL